MMIRICQLQQFLTLRSGLCLLVVLLIEGWLMAVSANAQTTETEERPTAVPSESAAEMLERFVRECVQISPGQEGFAQEVTLGTANPESFELPAFETQLTHAFRISRYEMTQELYQSIMDRNPSRWKGPRNSVENLSFQDAETFCAKLTARLHEQKLIPTSEVVRLPTAVEWEYCCRAGASTRYCFGDSAGEGDSTSVLDEFAWHTGNAAGNDPAVGVLKPNAWGLCDVHGYLWEFVTDNVKDVSQSSSNRRMVRGGSWRDPHLRLSCSSWSAVAATTVSDALGFRCVIAEKPVIKKPSKE